MLSGDIITDPNGRKWRVEGLEPVETDLILDLLRRETVQPGQKVHVPVSRATLSLEPM
jgi:hypothetical protein